MRHNLLQSANIVVSGLIHTRGDRDGSSIRRRCPLARIQRSLWGCVSCKMISLPALVHAILTRGHNSISLLRHRIDVQIYQRAALSSHPVGSGSARICTGRYDSSFVQRPHATFAYLTTPCLLGRSVVWLNNVSNSQQDADD